MPAKKSADREIMERLLRIYPKEDAEKAFSGIKSIFAKYADNSTIKGKKRKYEGKKLLTERDSFLITYADTIRAPGEKPLRALKRFLDGHVGKSISGVHILPFFPYSSDYGFSVKDYRKVNPGYGKWKDIEGIARKYRLMVDLVLNHASVKSEWFRGFLGGDKKYRDYFIGFGENQDTTGVFRPRTNPLLTKFKTKTGHKYVWTTFSADQADLNYRNPKVLLEMIDIMLFYISKGAELIRLDAIAYIWKELGTDCLNRPEVHEIVKLLRLVLDRAAPYALIVTEVNLPAKQNISYVGAGHESNIAYRFALPPLVLHSLIKHSPKEIYRCLRESRRAKTKITYFNFLASHDGIGILDAAKRLPKKELEMLIRETRKRGGRVSYKSEGKKRIPYELNVSYVAVAGGAGPPEEKAKRFLASQAVMLSVSGFPGIYIHSLIGSGNNPKAKKGDKRGINRTTVGLAGLEAELEGKGLRSSVFGGYKKMLDSRRRQEAFGPQKEEKIVGAGRELFVLQRGKGSKAVTIIVNLCGKEKMATGFAGKKDLIAGKRFGGRVEPYGHYFLM